MLLHRENVDVEIEGFVDRLARVGNVSSPNCLVGKKVKKKRQESVDDTMLLRDRNTSSLMESWLMPSKDEKLYPGATTGSIRLYCVFSIFVYLLLIHRSSSI